MKQFLAKSRVASMLTLLLLGCYVCMGATTTKVAREQQTEGLDSLLAATVETTSVAGLTVPQTTKFDTIKFLCSTDESVSVIVQIAPQDTLADGTRPWHNFSALDTIAAATQDTVVMGNLITFAGWRYRLIIDDIEAANSAYTILYEWRDK